MTYEHEIHLLKVILNSSISFLFSILLNSQKSNFHAAATLLYARIKWRSLPPKPFIKMIREVLG